MESNNKSSSFNIKYFINPPQTKIRTLSNTNNEIQKQNKFFMIMLAIVKLKKLELKVKKKNLLNSNTSSLIESNKMSNDKTLPFLHQSHQRQQKQQHNNNNNKLLYNRNKIIPNRPLSRTSAKTPLINMSLEPLTTNNHNSSIYHLKYDFVYGDHKLKICGKNDINRISSDLNNINRILKTDRKFISTSTSTQDMNEKTTFKNSEKKKNIYVLDLSTERETCLNFPLLQLPIELFQMKQLKRLHLDCNHIKYIPDEFGFSMVNLEVLTISNNRLKWLPMSLKNLKKLESIHLSHNKFDLFPFVLCQINTLKFLDLSSNYINDLPFEIEDLKSLECLLLFQNNLRSVPKSIGYLKNLRTLWLGSNQLFSLPQDICNLENLDWTPNNFDFSSNIANNPIIDPPMDICLKGIDYIREYFAQRDDNHYNNSINNIQNSFYQVNIATILEEGNE